MNGRAVESLSAAERARIRNREIGFVFQSFNLIARTIGLLDGQLVEERLAAAAL